MSYTPHQWQDNTITAPYGPLSAARLNEMEAGIVAASVLKTATLSLSSAQLLALYTTSVQIVAPPGAGKALWPVRGFGAYTFVTAPYDAGGYDTDIVYAGQEGADDATLGIYLGPAILTQTADEARVLTTRAGLETLYLLGNTALVVHHETANMTGGDSTLKIVLYYQVFTL